MKKKKILLISGGLLTLIIVMTIVFIVNKNSSNNEIVMQDNINPINNSFLTLMLEQSDGTYQESKSNTWPSGNYAFNSELSRCENGGELRWDREEGIVNLLSNKSDACYVYFDLYNVVQISNVEATKTYNSITVTVTTSGGENPVDKYYFSIDGGNSYQESSTPSYTFSNLTMNHEYTIQVYAKDTLGYESNEEIIEVTTDNYENPRVNSVTTNVSNNSITVSVSATAGTNSISRYYYSSNGGSSYVNTTSNSYTFTNLSPGQTYQIRVYVMDSNNIQSNVFSTSVQTDSAVYLSNVCSNGNNLSGCISSLYNSYGSDSTSLYYHNISLSNGAGDNSYRYAGASEDVNNYICFGSTSSICPDSNLYRIIGVFGDQVKLIMADYPTTSQTGTGGANSGTYYSRGWNASYYKGSQSISSIGAYQWNPSETNTWSSSTLNTTNLNSTNLNSLGSAWSNLIANHSWKVGGGSGANLSQSNAQTAYNYEVGANSSSTTYSAKIGLMYLSDYYYAATTTYWTYPGYSSSGASYDYRAATSNNWMYMGLHEWTISRDSSNIYNAFMVGYSGSSSANHVYYNPYAVRPVFYLNSDVEYASESGTQSDPIRLKID